MKNRFFRKTWNGELIVCNVKAVVWIEGIRVISSLPFLQKALKRKNSLTSKKKLIKRKPIHKQKPTNKQKATHKQKETNKMQTREQNT